MRWSSPPLPLVVPTLDRSTPERAPRRRPPPSDVALPGLMLPGEGSVAPVHGAGDLADDRAPTERRGFCPDFLELPAGEEAAQPPTFGCPERLVEVVEWRTGGERRDDRVDPQRVPDIAGHLTGLDDQRRVPAVPAAAQVVHDEVQFVRVLLGRGHVLDGDLLDHLRPGVELGQVVLGTGPDEL